MIDRRSANRGLVLVSKAAKVAFAFLLVALLLSGCGLRPKPASAATLTPTPAAKSTSTPTPTPAPGAKPTPVPATGTVTTPAAKSTPADAAKSGKEIKFTNVRTQLNRPGQVQFTFSLRDQNGHAVVAPAEQMQSATHIFERIAGAQDWEEIDYSETSFFVHTAESFELEVVFVLDFSNSMAQARLPDGRSSTQAMLDAFSKGIAALPGAHRIGVVEFHDRNQEPAVLSELTTDRDAIQTAVNDFAASSFDSGSSRVWDGVKKGASLFSSNQTNPNVIRALVFISDGRDTSSSITRKDVTALASKGGINLYVLGMGSVYEETALSDMARATNGYYYSAKEPDNLQGQLEAIVNDLRGQYKVSYITLRRQGSCNVRVQVTLGADSGAFESSALDMASAYGPDNVGRIAFDPPSINKSTGQATVYARALHLPRGINRFFFKLDTPKGISLNPVPRSQGGLLEGWSLSPRDDQGYYELSSGQTLAFGNFGLLFQIAVSGITEGRVWIPVTFDNSIYAAEKSFRYPSVITLELESGITFASNRDGNYEIYTMDADGSNLFRLTNNSAGDRHPSLSPDGKSIVFHSSRDGNEEIYVMNADGSNQRRLTNSPGIDAFPSWSPDGKLIAFHSNRDRNFEIYVMNADGTGQKRLTNNPAEDRHPSWSPDGKLIAFASNRDGNFEVYVMNADGSSQRRLTNNTAVDLDPTWSPDGKLIGFSSNRDGNYEVYVMNADGSNQRRLTNNPAYDVDPAWSADGRNIVFASTRDGNYEIYVMDNGGSNQRRLSENSADDVDPVWTPAVQ